MRTLDTIVDTLQDNIDFKEVGIFSDDYDGTIRIALDGDRIWFGRIKVVRLILNGQVVFEGAPNHLIEIKYPKVDGEVSAELQTYCPTCHSKSMHQLQEGITFNEPV